MDTDLPTPDQLLEVIGLAVLAPSVHNSQPWLFRIIPGGIELYADWDRQLPIADPDGRALRLSCGAALYNLRLGLRHLGYRAEVDLGFGPEEPIATVHVTGTSPTTPDEDALYLAVPKRRSNRYPFLDTNVSPAERAELIRAADEEGAWLTLVIGRPAVELVAGMVRIADDILMRDPAYRIELAAWSRDDGSSTDGVTRSAGGPAPEPQDALIGRDFGGPPRKADREFEPDPFIVVLGSHADSSSAVVAAGQALQHVLLTATRLGLSASLSSQAIDVPSVREQLRIGLHRFGPPQMVMRLGRGIPAPVTRRRPAADVVLAPDQAPPVPRASGVPSPSAL